MTSGLAETNTRLVAAAGWMVSVPWTLGAPEALTMIVSAWPQPLSA